MARSRSFIVVLAISIGSMAQVGLAQDALRPETAPKFELPPGRPPGNSPESGEKPPHISPRGEGKPEGRPEGEGRWRDWRGDRDRRGPRPEGEPGRPPGEKPSGDRPPFNMPPEAQAMRDQARKEFEKMTPEQRQKFWGNFKTWLDMPSDQRDRFQKMHDDRIQRAREEIRELIKRMGLELDDEQRKKFYGRYFEERKIIEEKLWKEMDERRKPLLSDMEKKLKEEFSKPAANPAEKPAGQPTENK